jgi:hypothetical protein
MMISPRRETIGSNEVGLSEAIPRRIEKTMTINPGKERRKELIGTNLVDAQARTPLTMMIGYRSKRKRRQIENNPVELLAMIPRRMRAMMTIDYRKERQKAESETIRSRY